MSCATSMTATCDEPPFRTISTAKQKAVMGRSQKAANQRSRGRSISGISIPMPEISPTLLSWWLRLRSTAADGQRPMGRCDCHRQCGSRAAMAHRRCSAARARGSPEEPRRHKGASGRACKRGCAIPAGQCYGRGGTGVGMRAWRLRGTQLDSDPLVRHSREGSVRAL